MNDLKRQAVQDRIIWARLGDAIEPRRLWMGIGLLSDHGLPLCCLQMFLAAKAFATCGGVDSALVVLLADRHALSTGTPASTVMRRAYDRTIEVAAIAALLQLRCTPIPASTLDVGAEFQEQLGRVQRGAFRSEGKVRHLPEYVQRAVADALYFSNIQSTKIGWSAYKSLVDERGRHHEPEVDSIAWEMDRRMSAMYVRPGVTLDSSRPKAVPYTELIDTSHRLMLTGKDRGGFEEKLTRPSVSPRRRRAVLEHLAITIDAYEDLVEPLPGVNIIKKAEQLQQKLECILNSLQSSDAAVIQPELKSIAL